MSSTLYRDGFNYIEFLRRRAFLGQLHPVNRDSQEPIIVGLMVPVETALAEVLYWSGQDMTRTEFTKYLRDNNIFVGNLEELQKAKQKAKEQGLQRVVIGKEKLKEIADNLEVSYTRIDGTKLIGRTGYVRDDGVIIPESRSKRHLSGIGRRLGFLPKIDDVWLLDRKPTEQEAETIRTILGLKKRPSPKDSQKEGIPIQKEAA